MRATQAARRRWRPHQDRRALAAQAGTRRTSRRLHPGPADGGLARSVFLYARFFPCLRVFLSKITELLARSNRRVLSVTFVSFSGILRGRTLLMVFCGSRDLSMLHNQFSLERSELVQTKQQRDRETAKSYTTNNLINPSVEDYSISDIGKIMHSNYDSKLIHLVMQQSDKIHHSSNYFQT